MCNKFRTLNSIVLLLFIFLLVPNIAFLQHNGSIKPLAPFLIFHKYLND